MRSTFVILSLAFIALVCVSLATAAPVYPTAADACAPFAVLAGTAFSANGVLTTIKVGSIGVSPGNAISGNFAVEAGTIEDNTVIAGNCAAAELTTYASLSTATCYANHTLQSADLAGLTLTPGVYCSATGTFGFSAATLTLDAQGDVAAKFVFQAASTLTTATATSFVLKNGTNANNVYWMVGTSASLGYSSNFVGNIYAQAAVNFGSGAILVGRAFAQTAVTFASGSTVTKPE